MLKVIDDNRENQYYIRDYKEYKVESTLSTGEKALSFLYPLKKEEDIVLEHYIRNKTDEYVIKEITDSDDDYISVYCKINIEDLEGKEWKSFDSTEQTITDCINLAIAGTGWSIKESNVTKKRTIRKTNSNAWDIIQQALTTYRTEIKIDSINKTLSFYTEVGEDKGCYFKENLNLKSLGKQANTYDFYTKLIAIGATTETTDADTEETTTSTVTVTVTNNQYSNKVKTLIWKDERYTVEESLREDASYKLEELSQPYVSYETNIYDLANMNVKYKDILSYSLGDTVTLISKARNTKIKLRIVKTVEYEDNPEDNYCELGSKKLTFAQIQAEEESVAETVDNITSDNGTISESALSGNISQIVAKLLASGEIEVNVQELNAIKIRVGNLEATVADITEAYIDKAYIDTLIADYAKITQLDAESARIDILETDNGTINELLAGGITADNISANFLESYKAEIVEETAGTIKTMKLDANQIDTGTMNTSKVTIAGANNRMIIKDNYMQINDIDESNNLYERYFAGIDTATNETVIRLRNADGNTILIDENGLTQAGFTEGYNTVEDGSLNAAKFDFQTIVTGINNGTETLDITKVGIDDTTLDVYLAQQNNTIDEQKETLEAHGTSINANTEAIKGKVSETTYSTDKEANETRFSNIETSIIATKEEINASVENNYTKKTETSEIVNAAIDEIEIGDRNRILNSNFSQGLNHWSTNSYMTLLEAEEDKPNLGIIYYNQSGLTSARLAQQWTEEIEVNTDGSKEFTVMFDYRITDKSVASNTLFAIRGFDVTGKTAQADSVWYRNITVANVTNELADGEWVTLKLTFKPTACRYLKVAPYGYQNGEMWWRGIKLVQGNMITTDWTPAPEDTETEIQNINTTVTEHTSKIATLTAKDSEIDSKVSSLESTTTTNTSKIGDLETSKTTMEQRLSSAEEKITDTAIINTVSASVTQAIDNNNTDYVSNTYASKTELKQTSNKITTTVSEASNYNLALNTCAKKNLNFWTGTVGRVVDNTDTELLYGTCMVINNTTTGTLRSRTHVFAVKPSTQYTVAIKFKRMGFCTGAGILFAGIKDASMVESTIYTSDYVHQLDTGLVTAEGVWVRKVYAFTTEADEVCGMIKIENLGSSTEGTNGALRYVELQINEGAIYDEDNNIKAMPYSQNPSECYTSVVEQDSAGLNVNHSSTSNRTHIDASGFYSQGLDSNGDYQNLSSVMGNTVATGNVYATIAHISNMYEVYKGRSALYVDVSSAAKGDGTSSNPYGSLMDCLEDQFYNNNALILIYNVTIYVTGSGSIPFEAVTIENFIGKQLSINIASTIKMQLSGTFNINNCNNIIYINGNRTNSATNDGAQIYQDTDIEIMHILNSHVIVRGCRYEYNPKVASGHGALCVEYGILNSYFNDFGNSYIGISATNQSIVSSDRDRGTCTIGYYSNNGSVVTLCCYDDADTSASVKCIKGSLKNTYEDNGNIFIKGNASYTASQNTSTTESTTKVEYLSYSSTGSAYYNYGYSCWNADGSNPHAGDWQSYGNCRGLWFFNYSGIQTALASATVKNGSTITLSRPNEKGNSGSTDIYLFGSTTTSASGTPAITKQYGKIGSLAWGQSGTFNLPNQVVTDFKNGTIRSLGIMEGGGYIVLNSSCKIKLKVQV